MTIDIERWIANTSGIVPWCLFQMPKMPIYLLIKQGYGQSTISVTAEEAIAEDWSLPKTSDAAYIAAWFIREPYLIAEMTNGTALNLTGLANVERQKEKTQEEVKMTSIAELQHQYEVQEYIALKANDLKRNLFGATSYDVERANKITNDARDTMFKLLEKMAELEKNANE